jgi:hypothetical protein
MPATVRRWIPPVVKARRVALLFDNYLVYVIFLRDINFIRNQNMFNRDHCCSSHHLIKLSRREIEASYIAARNMMPPEEYKPIRNGYTDVVEKLKNPLAIHKASEREEREEFEKLRKEAFERKKKNAIESFFSGKPLRKEKDEVQTSSFLSSFPKLFQNKKPQKETKPIFHNAIVKVIEDYAEESINVPVRKL